GITMALSLYSLATGQAVRNDIAMTGELTLTGKVLPIGGVKEKTIAARRVKIFNLILPADNQKDFEELPDYLREGITVHYADYFEDVLKVAFDAPES
ncbi:MAG: endopeptidase La, partial [Lewinellaceae bacterium]|nr:endopeptidase La [Lewinellaceae bacterium]